MRPALPFAIALTALVLTACSTGTPQSDLDGPSTVIMVAVAANGVSTLGVPFVDGVPVVEDVAVTITAANGTEPIELSFTLVDGVYSYDPDGLITTIEFPFAGAVSVALPAGNDYAFETTGTDVDDVWIVYGVTDAYVDITTSSVRLALQTLIQGASLDTATAISAVVPGERVDVFLTVTAPGGYAVPISDYTVEYVPDAGDGVVTASSNLGARVTATDEPGDDTFRLTATVSGWFDDKGVAAWMDAVVATYEMPFSMTVGLVLDGSAPVVSIEPVTSDTVGAPVALTGSAADDVEVARVQVFEGPQMIGSNDPNDQNQYGAAVVSLNGGVWSLPWTPERVGSHTLTVVAFDTSGNEGQRSTMIEVEAFVPQVLTFVDSEVVFATVTAGESVVLQGTAASGFDAGEVQLSIFSHSTMANSTISTADLTVADGMWTLAWTAPTVLGPHEVNYRYNGMPIAQAFIGLSVE